MRMRSQVRSLQSAVRLVVCVAAIQSSAWCQGAEIGESSRNAEDERLEQLFESCLTSYGQAYVEARNTLLKEKSLAEFLDAREKRLKSQPEHEAEALCFYLRAWLKHGEAYRRILAEDLYRKSGGIAGGSHVPDSGPDLMGWLLREFTKEKVPLIVLIESLHRSGEFGKKHGGATCSLYLLGIMSVADEAKWRGNGWLMWIDLRGTDFIPKHLFLGGEEKGILLRVANHLVVEGGFPKQFPLVHLRPLVRRACAFVLQQLADPSSVAPLIQASLVEDDTKTLAALRKALEGCTGTDAGKKALETAKEKIDAVLGKPDGRAAPAQPTVPRPEAPKPSTEPEGKKWGGFR